MIDYTMVEYQLLQEYVFDYQDNMPGAAEKILDSFKGFIWKYTELISNGRFQIEDESLRSFVALFSVNQTNRKCAHQYKYKPTVAAGLSETVKRIKSLFAQYTIVDIKNETIGTLLSMAKRYKDKDKPSFHNYVDKCFHYELYRAMIKLIKDPLTRSWYEPYNDDYQTDMNIPFEFEESLYKADQEWLVANADIITVPAKNPYYDESLDLNWINGVTCCDALKTLSPFEREILKYKYIDKMTDEDIADIYGFCRATINRKRLKAEQKLNQEMFK